MVGGQVSLVAGLVGYLIGSMPTANGLSKLWGIDLRASGSGNPGANNALRLGGYPLAIAVFLAEMSKGVLAVAVGLALGGELGAVVAGAGAIAGNVYNVWYSFRGGKGLAIAAGVLLAAWPVAFPFLIILAALGAATTRSSGLGTLIALGGAMVGAVLWVVFSWRNGWGVSPNMLMILVPTLIVLVTPKHLQDVRSRPKEPSRP